MITLPVIVTAAFGCVTGDFETFDVLVTERMVGVTDLLCFWSFLVSVTQVKGIAKWFCDIECVLFQGTVPEVWHFATARNNWFVHH